MRMWLGSCNSLEIPGKQERSISIEALSIITKSIEAGITPPNQGAGYCIGPPGDSGGFTESWRHFQDPRDKTHLNPMVQFISVKGNMDLIRQFPPKVWGSGTLEARCGWDMYRLDPNIRFWNPISGGWV